VVVVVVVVVTEPRWERATCQTNDRPDLVHVYATCFTVRDVPTLAHLVPRISGATHALAGAENGMTIATSARAAKEEEIKRFTRCSTDAKTECDKGSTSV